MNSLSQSSKTIIEENIRRYQSSTKNALENILCMGEAVNEIYQKVKSKELDNSDLEYFCKSVHLDSKGSTFRKYKAIGQNANHFRQCLDRLPATFSVLYEMATLSGDEFERFMSKITLSKNITLEQFKKIAMKSIVLTKNKMFNPPIIKSSRHNMAKIIKETNRFSVSLVRNVPKSKYDDFVEFLTNYRNDGWLHFDDPMIASYLNELGEEEFNQKLLHAQMSGDYSELAEIS